MAKRSAGNDDTATSNQTRRQRNRVKKRKCTAIFEEVDKFEDLAPRLHELLLTEPDGTRIYLRVRDRKTIN